MILYFDTETTGLCPGGIIQLSYIMQDENGVKGKNFFLFQPYIEPSSTRVHGITVQKLAILSGGKCFYDYIDEITADFESADLVVAHNFPFDFKFMSAEFERCYQTFHFKEKLDFKSYVFLVGLFILNGLSGVIATIHSKDVLGLGLSVTPQSFSIVNLFLGSIVGFILFAIVAIKNRKQMQIKPFLKAIPWSVAEGICNGLGNFLLLIALLKVDPSMQYPIVTGGCIFLSAILPLIIYKEKISAKGWVSVALAVIGSIVIIF